MGIPRTGAPGRGPITGLEKPGPGRTIPGCGPIPGPGGIIPGGRLAGNPPIPGCIPA